MVGEEKIVVDLLPFGTGLCTLLPRDSIARMSQRSLLDFFVNTNFELPETTLSG
jgi:hypothetical protein